MPIDSLHKLKGTAMRQKLRRARSQSRGFDSGVDEESIRKRLRPRYSKEKQHHESKNYIEVAASSSSDDQVISRRLRSRQKAMAASHQEAQSRNYKKVLRRAKPDRILSSGDNGFEPRHSIKSNISESSYLRRSLRPQQQKSSEEAIDTESGSDDDKINQRWPRPRQKEGRSSSDDEKRNRRRLRQPRESMSLRDTNKDEPIFRRLRSRIGQESKQSRSSQDDEPIGRRLRPRRSNMKDFSGIYDDSEEEDIEPLFRLRRSPRRVLRKAFTRDDMTKDRESKVHARRRDTIDQSSSSSSDSSKENDNKDIPTNTIHSKKNITHSSAVAGLASQRALVEELILIPLKYPELISRLGIRPARGLLFWGPPGTGKTLLAREIARESGLSFLARHGGEILSKYVGEAEKALTQLFAQAKSQAPCVLFFDEIDGLAPARRSETHQHVSVVTTLLALLDGLQDRGHVVVVAATNRIEAIDPALRRPGRLDKEVYFPPPNEEERAAILSLHAATWNPPPASALLGRLAARTNGFTGAELKALCDDAATIALRRQRPHLFTWTSPSTTAAVLIHKQQQQQKIEHNIVQVTARDLESALSLYNKNKRGAQCTEVQSQPLSAASTKLYGAFLDELDQALENHSLQQLPFAIRIRASSRRALSTVAGAILYKVGGQPFIDIGHAALLRQDAVSLESALTTLITAAHSGALLAPDADRLWLHATPEFKIALHALLRDSPPNIPIVTTQLIDGGIDGDDENILLWELCPVLLTLDLDQERADRRGYFRRVLNDVLSALNACPPSSREGTQDDEVRNPQFPDDDEEDNDSPPSTLDPVHILSLDSYIATATKHLDVHALERWTHTKLWPLVDSQLAAWPKSIDISALMCGIKQAATSEI